MTTTLRPSSAEQRFADGRRSRAYDIRVGDRTVGSLRLRTETEPGGQAAVPAPVGRVEGLTVDLAERRRGRGAVAVLTAEEVLRGWGCTRVWAAIPGTAQEALGLASALGYRETNCHLTKILRDAPPLPPGSEGRPLVESEMADFIETTHELFVRSCVAQGLDEGFAETKSREAFAELLPEGAATTGAALRVLTHEGEPVGTLWLSLARPETEGAFVYGVRVDEEYRGRGHGRTLMLLAERASIAAGAPTLELNVFANNIAARTLYASLGYETKLLHFNKPLL